MVKEFLTDDRSAAFGRRDSLQITGCPAFAGANGRGRGLRSPADVQTCTQALTPYAMASFLGCDSGSESPLATAVSSDSAS